jgi:uncharacterized membrane protein YhdT
MQQEDRDAFFEEDSRYPQTNREAWLTFAFFLANCFLIGGIALIAGYNKPPEDIQLIAGFPAWYLYGAVVGAILECLLGVALVAFFFKDMSIQPEDDQGGERG